MLRYLSEAWLQAADALLQESGLRSGEDREFVVEQRVGDTVYHLVVGAQNARLHSGPAEKPDVVFIQDRATAVQLARGEVSAEEAVLNGLTRLQGDPLVLIALRPALAGVSDVFASLRSRTDFG